MPTTETNLCQPLWYSKLAKVDVEGNSILLQKDDNIFMRNSMYPKTFYQAEANPSQQSIYFKQ